MQHDGCYKNTLKANTPIMNFAKNREFCQKP